jgi:hypothetical protein
MNVTEVLEHLEQKLSAAPTNVINIKHMIFFMCCHKVIAAKGLVLLYYV